MTSNCFFSWTRMDDIFHFFVRDLNLAQNDTYNHLIRSKTCSIDRKSNGEFVGKKSWPKIRSEDEVRTIFMKKKRKKTRSLQIMISFVKGFLCKWHVILHGILNKFWRDRFFRIFSLMKFVITSSSDRLFGQDFFPTNSPVYFLSIAHVFEWIRGL